MGYKSWKVAAPDPEGRAALEREGVHPLVAAVLSARGMSSVEQMSFHGFVINVCHVELVIIFQGIAEYGKRE